MENDDIELFANGIDDEKTVPDIPWTEEHENILVDWADKAMCYRWLHSKSNQRFSKQNAWYTIPVIVMSTLTGTANFAQDRFPEDYRPYVPMMIGAVNIFAGILTTIQQFLKVSELNEAHRVASISWDKFYRNIKVELAKNPRERTSAAHILKTAKEEFDRLMETSPVISDNIIELFKQTFSDINEPTSDRAKTFDELKKPEICDSLESTRHSVYKPKENIMTVRPPSNMLELIKKKRDEARKTEIVEIFINSFRKEYSREPTTEEVYENLKEQVALDTIKRVFGKTKPEEQKPSMSSIQAVSMFKNALSAINVKRNVGEPLERFPKGDDNV